MTTTITLHEIHSGLVAFGEDAKVLSQTDLDFMLMVDLDKPHLETVIRKGVRSVEKLRFPPMSFCFAPQDHPSRKTLEEKNHKTLSALAKAGVAYNIATTQQGETP